MQLPKDWSSGRWLLHGANGHLQFSINSWSKNTGVKLLIVFNDDCQSGAWTISFLLFPDGSPWLDQLPFEQLALDDSLEYVSTKASSLEVLFEELPNNQGAISFDCIFSGAKNVCIPSVDDKRTLINWSSNFKADSCSFRPSWMSWWPAGTSLPEKVAGSWAIAIVLFSIGKS